MATAADGLERRFFEWMASGAASQTSRNLLLHAKYAVLNVGAALPRHGRDRAQRRCVEQAACHGHDPRRRHPARGAPNRHPDMIPPPARAAEPPDVERPPAHRGSPSLVARNFGPTGSSSDPRRPASPHHWRLTPTAPSSPGGRVRPKPHAHQLAHTQSLPPLGKDVGA
jgi:hypothetical protein